MRSPLIHDELSRFYTPPQASLILEATAQKTTERLLRDQRWVLVGSREEYMVNGDN
jgi:hypothetical protein